MTKQRSQVIDVCRGLGILLVLFGHAMEITFLDKATLADTQFPLWKVIYSFHMPLFFFISGLVHRQKTVKESLETCLTLILAAVSTHLFDWALHLLRTPFDLGQTFLSVVTLSYFSTVVVWFLVAQGFVQLAANLIQNSGPTGRVMTVLIVVGLFVLNQRSGLRWFQIQAIAPGLIFYAVGIFCSHRVKSWARSQNTERLTRVALIVTPLALISLVFSALMNSGCSTNVNAFCPSYQGQFAIMFATGKYGFLPLSLVSAASGIAFVMAISFWILASGSDDIKAWLGHMGQNTLDLLILNGFVVVYVQRFLAKVFHIDTGLPSTLAWSLGIVAAQVLLLPAWRLLSEPWISACRQISKNCTGFVGASFGNAPKVG